MMKIYAIGKLTALLLLCAVCSSVQAQGTPVLPYMSTWIRTLFDDETQAAARTTLGAEAIVTEGSLTDSVIISADIKDGEVTEVDLNATNTPGAGEDNYVLTYNHAATNFTWAVDATGAGGGDPILVDTTAIADASGVDLTSGVGVDITLNAGASPDTATFAFDGTEIDAITWSDNANASNVWTFDVSGTNHTMTAGNGLMTFSHTVTSTGLLTGSAGAYFMNGATDDGFIRIYEDTDDGGNYTQIAAVAQAGDITLTLPPDDGDAGEQLQTNGAGVLTWEAAGAGSGDPVLVNTTAITDGSGVDLTNGTGLTITLNAGASPDTATFATTLGTNIAAAEMANEDHGDGAWSGGALEIQSMTVNSAATSMYYVGMYDSDTGSNLAVYTDNNLTYTENTGTLGATEFVGGGSGLTLASTDLTDTADILYESELDAFTELDTQIADKALINLADGGTFTGNIIANANLSIGNTTTTAGVLTLLEDDDDGANFASFMVPALAGNTVYTLPVDDGDAGEQLQTDGSGVMSWESAGSAGTLDKARMTRDAAQALVSWGWRKIAFDAQTFDVGGIADFATNDRFDIGTTAYYLIIANITLPNLDSAEILAVGIYVDGTLARQGTATGAGTNSTVGICLSHMQYLTNGQTVEMYVYHGEGANQNTDVSLQSKPSMSVVQMQ